MMSEHFGPYELRWQIGRGGMGVVHHAYDSAHDRYVALKVLDASVSDDPELCRRFRREAQIVARLRNPHVIPVHAFGEIGNRLYLDMRLVDGSDLGVLLESGPLGRERAVEITEQVAEALDSAHDAGLVHRDVKPSNILVSRSDSGRDFAYLVDFGLAKPVDADRTFSGQYAGTADYMSPERFRGGEAGPTADVYALACVLYQCLTGAKVFGAGSRDEALYHHLNSPPPRPSDGHPEIPEAIDDVIARGLAKDPADRYRSAGEFAEGARAALRATPHGRAPIPAVRARPSFRRRGWLVALIVAVLMAAGVVAIVASTRHGPPGADARALGEESLGRLDPASGRLLDHVPLPGGAQIITTGGGFLWAADTDSNTVSKIDPATLAVERRVGVGFAPAAIAFGAKFVWVANGEAGTVSRVDPDSFDIRNVDVGASPAGLVVAGGWVWVSNSGDGTVSRIDPSSLRIVQTLSIGGDPTGIASDGSDVWVAQSTSNSVTKIDGRTFAVLPPIEVGQDPKGVTVADGNVWVTNNLSRTVTRIPSEATSADATVLVGDYPTQVAVVAGHVWVILAGESAVAEVDARTSRMVATVPLGSRPVGLATADGRLWVATTVDPARHRGGTLRLIGDALDTVDPSYAGPFPLLTSSYDGLVAYRHAGGAEASRVVPDLAKAIPKPTDQGRTYTFELRRGVRWSTGREVTVGDVRRGIERAILSCCGFLSDLVVGADTCTPTRCAPSGVTTDPVANIVTIRLVRPDAEFLGKLAGPAVPEQTPLADQKGRPIAATGPYQVSTFVPGKRVVLVRNPYFRSWSDAAQPAGYPDRIEWVMHPPGNPSKSAAAVSRGDSDWTDARGAGSVATLRAQFGDHLLIEPTLFTSGVELNTTIPPFNDPHVRQALSYAIDRLAVATHWQGQVRITCQTLPPNFPAHQAYCPRQIRADDGGWKAPDLLTAMRLVRASPTFGMKVELLSFDGLTPARDVVTALTELGYDARVSWWQGSDSAYFDHLADSRSGVQAAMVGANFDPPVVNGLPSQFGCASRRPADPSNVNWGLYCDQELDRLMNEALAAQAASPAKGNDAWAKVDRRITDEAAWIPLVNRSSVEVTSTRVHHYQYSPVLGVFFADLYLK